MKTNQNKDLERLTADKTTVEYLTFSEANV